MAVSARRVALVLVLVTLGFAALTVAAQTFSNVVGGPYRNLFGLVTLLDVKKEESIFTWYSEVLLLLGAVLLAFVWLARRRAGDRYSVHWAGLGAILLFLSVDEGASVHEKLGSVGRFALNVMGLSQDGFLSYAWIVPALVLVLLVGALYVPFFLHLARREKLLFALAAVMFVGSAVFLESVSAYYVSTYGPQSQMSLAQLTGVVAITTAEETGEALGVIVLIYAVLDLLRRDPAEVTLDLKK